MVQLVFPQCGFTAEEEHDMTTLDEADPPTNESCHSIFSVEWWGRYHLGSGVSTLFLRHTAELLMPLMGVCGDLSSSL
jgi:hypothetical protein